MKEIVLADKAILSHKGKLLQYIRDFNSKYPDCFVKLAVDASVLDMDVCRAACEIFCSLDIRLAGQSKGGTYLFDKKFFNKRAQMLNTLGLVFGFEMDFAKDAGDSVKAFRDRLDFAVNLYPNHINFLQIEESKNSVRPTATFSTQDISGCYETAFACQVFYSAGRAVTWFVPVLNALKISASKFFRDFAEWQKINNCGPDSNWELSKSSHKEIEKMQLSFLKFKFEEKAKSDIFIAVNDIVRINGAFSRCFGEGEETVLELNYNADELMGAGSLNIESFSENSFFEKSRVKVFWNGSDCQWQYC